MAKFAEHIKAHPQRSDESERTAYYRQWLMALESLLDELQLTGAGEQVAYREDRRRSYLATEHGSPVAFQRHLRTFMTIAIAIAIATAICGHA